MNTSRRQMILQLGAVMIGCAAPSSWAEPLKQKHAPWKETMWRGRPVFQQGSSRRAVVLLHEINGMSPWCIDLGQELFNEDFRVYMPLLFGHVGQDSGFFGYLESCTFGGFECSTAGRKFTSVTRPIQWVQTFVNDLEKNPNLDRIAVIGMCQSGAFPIATMRENSKVRAVVLNQPALPFGKANRADIGLPHGVMEIAKKSNTPMLAFRFANDTICTECRFHFLEEYFGKEQFHAVTFDHCDCTPTFTHRCHAVLTGTTEDPRRRGRAMVKAFFDEHLQAASSHLDGLTL